MLFVFFTLLSTTQLLGVARGASCSVDSENKCRCSESATAHLDVSCYFRYPYVCIRRYSYVDLYIQFQAQ